MQSTRGNRFRTWEKFLLRFSRQTFSTDRPSLMFVRVKRIWRIYFTCTRIRMVSYNPPTDFRSILPTSYALSTHYRYCGYFVHTQQTRYYHMHFTLYFHSIADDWTEEKIGYTIQSLIVIKIFVWLCASIVCDIVRKATPFAPGECLQHVRPHVCNRVCANCCIFLCVHVHGYMCVCVYLAPRAT